MLINFDTLAFTILFNENLRLSSCSRTRIDCCKSLWQEDVPYKIFHQDIQNIPAPLTDVVLYNYEPNTLARGSGVFCTLQYSLGALTRYTPNVCIILRV